MNMKNLNKLSQALILTLTATSIISCASKTEEWVDIPLSDNVFYEKRPELNSDLIEISLLADQDLEYMINMKQGGSISYHWQANNLPDPELLLAEFHGHTIRTSNAPGEVMFYKRGNGDSSEGYIVAPFDGIHGWYFSNESSEDINIFINISGFYSLIEE